MANPGPAVTTSSHPSNVTTNQSLRVIATLKNVNANAIASYPMQVNNSSVFLPQSLIVTDLNNAGASVTPTGLALGVATSAGGSSLYGAITAANLSTPQGVSLVAPSASTTATTVQTLYLNVTAGLTTAVVGATFDVYVYGYDFSVSN
ncbi:hypothetical protein UFOVP192_46 [uncultured Caudovirales phage]|uniref:Uncharacterized protein n=1 Tax=uncultured Caudovirales phage TaxID=2100421 RepID=A0A6J7WFF8_9CAUD|nr:hypothetical protein UFOVP192_46 [uncultured Caudovirales phage]